ncbi:hypothetical protein FIF62_04760 [Salmonella enterica subsp. enterica]|nr:hypothetical protein [Salmonella enterica subsp. enterica serovar Heidelberg]EBG0600220.1 hypothetical protein [Salmonella enterica subsp. enterica serovar Heidelberg]
MRHVYVASHGPFARGLINSLSLLIGDEHGVTPVCAYDGDIVTTEQLEQTLENLIAQANGEEVVVFTDLLGGSINNSAAKVQDFIDKILPSLLPLLFTLGMYKLIRKGVNINWILLGTVVFGLLASALGLL